MDAAFRQWLADADEQAMEDAFFNSECPHVFAVDWGEDDADIVAYCSECLGLDSLRAEWRGDTLVIIHDENESIVPLEFDEGDRHVTVQTLNEVLQPEYEIRFLVCSHGSDTAGFIALTAADWQSLDSEMTQAADQNCVRLSDLPNIFTEMTDKHLPDAARQRLQRMVERNRESL